MNNEKITAGSLNPVVKRYATATLIVGSAILLRAALDPWLDNGGFVIVFLAVIIASWIGGVRVALYSVVLSLAISWLLASIYGSSEPPPSAFPFLSWLALFVFIAVLTARLSESSRAAQRRAQAEAKEAIRQREQMRTTLSCIGDAVIVTDREGRLTMMNPVAESLTGWMAHEAIGRSLEEVFKIANEQTRQPIENPAQRVLKEGVIIGLANHTILLGKDGVERPIDDSAAPIRDKNGEMLGVVLIFRDVTERRRTEKALLDADQRKDEFLAILAHELRNPLAPICMALNLLRAPSVDGPTADWAKEVMERQVHVLVRLVDDLLDVSRIMRGKIELRQELVDLRHIISRAVETAQPVIDGKEHELIVSICEGPLLLCADSVRLAQAVSNLLTNAAKYTEPRGKIWLSGDTDGEEVLIRVRDSGIGIPADMLPRVFDLFTQVDSSTSRSQGGLGIGLTLVKSLVEMNGGTVEAHSDGAEQGSEFVIRLPSAPASKAAVETADAAAAASQQTYTKHRILVVDDNADAAETLTALLRLEGHEVDVVHDGPTALETVRVRQPKIIFLDIGMPGMDGFEVARRLRQLPEANSAVLVAVTGWGQDEDRRRTRDAGFDHHLVKPVEAIAINELLAGA